MIYATVTGRLTRDSELRNAGKDQVCGLSIASNKKVRGQNTVTYCSASVWGQRGAALSQYLTKGTAVTVVGELSTREHNGKTYLELRVDAIDFMGGGGNKSESGDNRGGQKQQSRNNEYSNDDYGGVDDSDVPF